MKIKFSAISQIFTGIIILLLLTTPALATTRTVPTLLYPTIQSAINASGAGDTVLVKAGKYAENIFLRSGVDVSGEGYRSTAIVGTKKSVETVNADAVDNCRFEGFAVYGNSSSIYGVAIYGGSLTVSNNFVAAGLSQTGIFITGNSTARIIGNRISGNNRGLYVQDSAPEVIGNDVYENKDGISIASASRGVFRNNNIYANGFTDNATTDYGLIINASKPLVTNNLIHDNPETGVYVVWSGSDGARLINNTIVRNVYDGIWSAFDAKPVIKNNIVTDNGFGIAASHNAMPEISYNDVWSNSDNYNSQSGGVSAAGPGDISKDPLFDPLSPEGFHLLEESPCIDAGDPNPIYNDIDDSRNDMGAYGGQDGATGAGASVQNGFVFTTVGKIPVSEITQTAGDLAGLANVSTAAANDLYIYPYKDAPFGGRLWISGLFGDDDTTVRYYQILVAKWDGATPPATGDFTPIDDRLTKVLYTVASDGTVSSSRETIGPLPNSAGLPGLFMRTNTGYWAHRDLKIVWDTRWLPNGKYDITYKAYNSAYTQVFPMSTTQDRITLHIDNSPVEAIIHSVSYDSGAPISTCGKIALVSPTENLRFEVTAWHPNGFMRNFAMSAPFGANQNAGTILSEKYAGSHDGSRPVWHGVMTTTFNSEDAPGSLVPWQTCAYQFRLSAVARTTDGYTHIKRDEYNDHYYIDLQPAGMCLANTDGDNDVDSIDLGVMALEYGRQDCQ